MKLTIKGRRESIDIEPGETVREALARAGLGLQTPCNGKGVCGRCRIRTDDVDVPDTPSRHLSAADAAEGVRLACRLVPRADLEIELLPGTELAADAVVVPRSGSKTQPFVPRSDAQRSVSRDEDSAEHALRDARLHRAPQGERSCAVLQSPPLGLALDLGTTTLVGTVVSLESGEELSTRATLNPQVRYGHDVITRIEMGSEPTGLEQLAAVVRRGINELAERACADACASPEAITQVVIGGNTTMLQLAAEIDPAPLGQTPFTVSIDGGRTYPADRFGLDVHPDCAVYIPPVLHAFAGSDVTAGLLVSEDFFDEESTTLFVDVGTNGELALSADGRHVTTSTAAGPAFEGLGLSCGMIAQPGAIEAAWTEDSALRMHTVAGAPAVGICGSGTVDLVAALYRLGVLDQTGRMPSPDEAGALPRGLARRIFEVEGEDDEPIPAFKLANDVYLSQDDIRQVQLAKAAVRAAIDMVLEELGVTAVDRVVLAGGFGRTLRPKSMRDIGMLPPGLGRHVSQVGNTSRRGCVELLRSTDSRRHLEELSESVSHLMLAERPDYMDCFVESIELPPLRASRREERRAVVVEERPLP